jgi:hypothetical protein
VRATTIDGMTDPRALPDDRPNIGTDPLEVDIAEVQGDSLPADQDAVLEDDQVEMPDEATLSEQEWGVSPMPDRELLAEAARDDPRTDVDRLVDSDLVGLAGDATGDASADVTSLDALSDTELRSGETTDPLVAIEEGEVWIPPSDPPTVPSDDPQGIQIAAGAGVSATDEPYDDDHRSGELDEEGSLNARVREALLADAATSTLADRLEIAVVGSTAIIRGPVDGIEDTDAIVEVASRVAGIDDVRDETEVAGL